MTIENEQAEVSAEATEQTEAMTPDNTEGEATEETQPPTEQQLREQIKAELQKELREKYRQIGKREQAISKKQKEYEALSSKADNYSKLLQLREQGNRAQLLKELNVDIDDLTSDLVSGNFNYNPKQDELSELREQLKALQSERESEKLAKQQAEVSKQTEQVNDYIVSLIDEKQYDFVKAKGKAAISEIYAAAQEVYNSTGNVNLADVIEEFNNHYMEEAEALFNTPFAQKKFEEKYNEYLQTKAAEKQRPSTISGKMTTSGSPASPDLPGKGTAAGLIAAIRKHSKK